MTKLLLTLTAALSLTISARANIGDTHADAQARYGEPDHLNPAGDPCYYKDGWEIIQSYNVKGICYGVSYLRLDGQPVTQEQTNAFWNANFATTPSQWVFQSHPDTETEIHQVSYSDAVTGYQFWTFWQKKVDGNWFATVSFGDTKLQGAVETTTQNNPSLLPL
jgi:hypothetical protein